MTDAELEGIAAQAFNMARQEMEQRGTFSCLIASWHEGEGLHRMKKIEALLIEKLGEGWLNSGQAKDHAFAVIRTCTDMMPPPAIVFATVVNQFESSDKFMSLPEEEQKRIASPKSHVDHWSLVKRGLLSVHDALFCCAQTKERVCIYTRAFGRGYEDAFPLVKTHDQKHWDGRLKMYGNATTTARMSLIDWKIL
jgi:hypothetical protein